MADDFFAELPRIRLDRKPRSRKTIWTVHEEAEDEIAASSHIELNTTLQSVLGKLKYISHFHLEFHFIFKQIYF